MPFAIEDLLKGLLIREHPDLISDGKLRGPLITSHSLVKLADEQCESGAMER